MSEVQLQAIDASKAIEHYGVMGMKWGVRKDRDTRMANRDAKKMAKAQVAYGAGAGTKRKLMDRKIKQRSNVSAKYAEAYKEAYAKQPHEKLAAKAEKKHLKDLKKASQNQTVNAGISLAAAAATPVISKHAANLIGSAVYYKTGDMGKANTAAMLGAHGARALTLTAGNARYVSTRNARRRLDYRY